MQHPFQEAFGGGSHRAGPKSRKPERGSQGGCSPGEAPPHLPLHSHAGLNHPPGVVGGLAGRAQPFFQLRCVLLPRASARSSRDRLPARARRVALPPRAHKESEQRSYQRTAIKRVSGAKCRHRNGETIVTAGIMRLSYQTPNRTLQHYPRTGNCPPPPRSSSTGRASCAGRGCTATTPAARSHPRSSQRCVHWPEL